MVAALGAIGAAGISAISNAASTRSQFKYQQQLMDRQAWLNYKWGKKSTLNAPSWTRAGLEKAGYNPMLAVQNATNGVNSSWTSGGSVDSPNYGQAVTNAIDIARLRNETNAAESQINLNNANAELSNAQSVEQVLTNKYVDERVKTQIANTQADTELKKATIDNFNNSIELGYYTVNANNAVSVANNIRDNAMAKYGIDRGTPPKWVTGVGAALGAGAGIYAAIQNSKPKLKKYR